MSFFNKLRAFPAYHNMDDALDSAVKAAARKHKAFANTQGNSFTEFARKQPEGVQDSLFRLADVVKQVDTTFTDGDTSITNIRTALAQVRALNEDIRAKRKNATALTQKAEKSSKQVDAAEKKKNTAMVKGSPDLARAENEYDMAVRQREIDSQAAEERNQQLKIEDREYKKQLIFAVLNALDEYVTTKQTAAASAVSIGNQIEQIGDVIPFYDDSQAEVIQGLIQTLRSEPLE